VDTLYRRLHHTTLYQPILSSHHHRCHYYSDPNILESYTAFWFLVTDFRLLVTHFASITPAICSTPAQNTPIPTVLRDHITYIMSYPVPSPFQPYVLHLILINSVFVQRAIRLPILDFRLQHIGASIHTSPNLRLLPAIPVLPTAALSNHPGLLPAAAASCCPRVWADLGAFARLLRRERRSGRSRPEKVGSPRGRRDTSTTTIAEG
jgi:hypothetical protein